MNAQLLDRLVEWDKDPRAGVTGDWKIELATQDKLCRVTWKRCEEKYKTILTQAPCFRYSAQIISGDTTIPFEFVSARNRVKQTAFSEAFRALERWHSETQHQTSPTILRRCNQPTNQPTNQKTNDDMKTTTENITRRRARHHKALEVVALWVNCNTPGNMLWRKLARLERKVYQACVAYSNDASFGVEKWEAVKAEARIELAAIFGGAIPKGVYINGDPRGHMLKLDCDARSVPDGMERDWGGNGLLAAEIPAEGGR